LHNSRRITQFDCPILSEIQLAGFCGSCFGEPSQRARGFGKDVGRDKNIVVGVLAVPAGAAQRVADDLVDAGVRIIFNYSEGLLDVPSDVTVHTSNPAVELLHALYFHLA
jgi:redox-sensing transcriptional repressor